MLAKLSYFSLVHFTLRSIVPTCQRAIEKTRQPWQEIFRKRKGEQTDKKLSFSMYKILKIYGRYFELGQWPNLFGSPNESLNDPRALIGGEPSSLLPTSFRAAFQDSYKCPWQSPNENWEKVTISQILKNHGFSYNNEFQRKWNEYGLS